MNKKSKKAVALVKTLYKQQQQITKYDKILNKDPYNTKVEDKQLALIKASKPKLNQLRKAAPDVYHNLNPFGAFKKKSAVDAMIRHIKSSDKASVRGEKASSRGRLFGGGSHHSSEQARDDAGRWT